MKRLLLSAACIAALSAAHPGTARAQWVVQCANCGTEMTQIISWARALINEAKQIALATQQLEQLVQTYQAVTGVRDVGSAIIALNALGIQNPLGNMDPYQIQVIVRGTGSADTIRALVTANLQANNVYAAPDTDWQAQEMARNANSLAGLQALAQTGLQAINGRLQQIAALPARLAAATTLKDVEDVHAQISAAASSAQAQGVQVQHIQTLAALQPRIIEQRNAEHERQEMCKFIASLRENEDGLAPPPDCTSLAPSTVSLVADGSAPSVNLGPDSGYSNSSGGGLMMQQAWGEAAAQNARALGVNPDALEATCVIESNCRNVAGSGSVSGPFQMTDATYSRDIQQALAENPGLQASGGKSDPATQAIAASQDLKNAANALQRAGVPADVLAARGYYQFGAGYGIALATASDSQSMTSLLRSYTSAQLAANGITQSTTVGDWRRSIVSKLGNAAYAPILNV